jgi:hypothetical protein
VKAAHSLLVTIVFDKPCNEGEAAAAFRYAAHGPFDATNLTRDGAPSVFSIRTVVAAPPATAGKIMRPKPKRWRIEPFKIDGQRLRGPDGALLNAIYDRDDVLVAFMSRIASINESERHPWKIWQAVTGQGPIHCGELLAAHDIAAASQAAHLSFPDQLPQQRQRRAKQRRIR